MNTNERNQLAGQIAAELTPEAVRMVKHYNHLCVTQPHAPAPSNLWSALKTSATYWSLKFIQFNSVELGRIEAEVCRRIGW